MESQILCSEGMMCFIHNIHKTTVEEGGLGRRRRTKGFYWEISLGSGSMYSGTGWNIDKAR